MQNYYEILDVPSRASQKEIKERFRFLANAYHPDKFATPAHKTQAEVTFKKINEAYQVLSVPAKRAEYDRSLGITPYSRPPQQPRPTPYGHNQPSSRPNDIYSIGQMVVRTFAIVVLFYVASFIALRMGVGGLVMFLILVAVIYFRYFWK
ncbi:MAG: DnaJ domain-containing protein [Anaerolineae bacterium]|jgi:curved DNA-binding protein CbpA|nr:DnaJ domain-containing protein [Anaerolineae bacterium]